MREDASGQTTRKSPWLGSVIGAIVGGVGRLLVVVCFAYYVLNWGGPFFRLQGGASLSDILTGYERWPLFLLSAGIGVIVGGLGGATCQPIKGAAIGAGLSGLFCVGLFVLPANLAIGMSGGGATDYSTDRGAVGVGLVAMIVVGAIAGGIGAIVGKVFVTKAETQ